MKIILSLIALPLLTGCGFVSIGAFFADDRDPEETTHLIERANIFGKMTPAMHLRRATSNPWTRDPGRLDSSERNFREFSPIPYLYAWWLMIEAAAQQRGK